MDEGTDNYDKWKWKIKGKAELKKNKKQTKQTAMIQNFPNGIEKS